MMNRKGFTADRAADRGRDHRHSGGHRDSEVRDDQGQGQAGLGQD